MRPAEETPIAALRREARKPKERSGDMNLRTVVTLALCPVVATVMIGCADQTSEPEETATVSTELAFDVRTDDHIAGRFTKDGVTLGFEYERQGDRKTAVLRTADGRELTRSTLQSGIDSSTILDGRLQVVGSPSTEPTLMGDRNALEELGRSPEGKLVASLVETLAREGIDPELYSSRALAGDMSPQSLAGPGWLHCGQAYSIPTWSIWGLVNISATTRSPKFGNLRMWDLWATDLLVRPGYYEHIAAPFFFWRVTLENNCRYGDVPLYVHAW
jgi:hypothetical protein